MRKITLIISLVILISQTSLTDAQNKELRTVFVSIHSGLYITSLSNFDKVYDSNSGIVYGFGAALPLSSRSYLYGKATFFSKNGTAVIQQYGYTNGSWVYSETKGGEAKYRQWIINGGYLLNFFIDPEFTLGINGGITFINTNEEQKDKAGNVSFSSSGGGIFGFFVGTDIEKNFDNSPFPIFLDVQYNISRIDVARFLGNYGGLNLNLGARYYFKDRRLD